MSSRRSLHKELQPIGKAAGKAGWTWQWDGQGHIRWTGPDGQVVVSPSSPGGRRSRSMNNVFAMFKRAGLVISSKS